MTLAKTDAGVRMLKDRRGGLSPRQRAALILIDGQRSVEDVLAATSGGVSRAEIEQLVEMGLVAEPAAPQRAPEPSAQDFTDSTCAGWDDYVRAYAIATELAAQLGRRDIQRRWRSKPPGRSRSWKRSGRACARRSARSSSPAWKPRCGCAEAACRDASRAGSAHPGYNRGLSPLPHPGAGAVTSGHAASDLAVQAVR